MSPEVYRTFARIAAEYYKDAAPRAVLEVGASGWTLLSIPVFQKSRKVALNLSFEKPSAELSDCELVAGNSQKMDFKSGEFDCILSSSTFEHDKYFWKSLDEIYRVLSVGGLLIIGVPIYMKLPTDYKNTTLTYARHGYSYNADFYRFSEQAVREVILEPYEIDGWNIVRRYPNPYLIASGIKKASSGATA